MKRAASAASEPSVSHEARQPHKKRG